MTTLLQPRHRRGAIIAVSAGIALIVAVACEAPVPDPIGPPSASEAATIPDEFRVERDTALALRSLDCKTNVACGADTVVRLGYVIRDDRTGAAVDSIVDRIITVSDRQGKVYSVRYRPGGAAREVHDAVITRDATPRCTPAQTDLKRRLDPGSAGWPHCE